MKLLVAIPALNEELSIGSVIDSTLKFFPNSTILVIDDGSIDSTATIAKQHGARVISLPFNVGVGSALRVAFKFAIENDFNRVLQIDADGQHLPSEAVELLSVSTQDCIVIGSRFLDNKKSYKTSRARRFAMVILAGITSRICKVKLTDVTSGFRLTSGKAIGLFAKNYPREYLGDTVESLILAHRSQVEIIEVSVEMNQRLFGSPSQNFVKSTWYLLRALFMIVLSIFRKS